LDEISAYYVTDEIRGMMRGMTVAIPQRHWQRQFGALSVSRRVKPSGDRRVKTSHLRKDRFDLQVFWRLLPRKEARSGESTQDGENSGDTLVTRARLDTDPHRGDLAGKSRNGPKVPAATVVRPKTAKRADRLGRLKTARFAERPGSGIKTSKRADRLTG
jgi:hypothetical protein